MKNFHHWLAEVIEAFFESALIFALVIVGAYLAAKTPGCEAFAATRPGKARWQVKTAPPEDGRSTYVGLPVLMNLWGPSGISRTEYQTSRIPPAVWTSPIADLHEGQRVHTGGYMAVVASEPDGDYHLQLTTGSDSVLCLVVEIPDPRYVKNKALAERLTYVRRYVRGLMGSQQHEPSHAGSILSPAPRICVSGALFYDSQHVGRDGSVEPRGKRGMMAPSPVEIHPADVMWIDDGTGCERGPPLLWFEGDE